MEWNLLFFFNSILLGVGLAMDAFSVSLSNGLNEPHMRVKKMCIIAGTFGFFQAFMPMAGWFCVHTIVEYFKAFEKFIPWIALFLLLYIGGKMVWEGLYGEEEAEEVVRLGAAGLLMQGIATSIDALSVGFTIADYGFVMAFVCCHYLLYQLFRSDHRQKIWNPICRQSNCFRRCDSGFHWTGNLHHRDLLIRKHLIQE